MLRDVVRKLKKLKVEPVPFDPSSLNDEVASRTEWDPARGGGASFGTHRLVQAGPGRLVFKAAPGAIAFYGVFLVVGLGVLIGFGILNPSADGWERLMLILFGSLFAAIGGGMMYFGTAPIVFDRRRGEYWKGRVSPGSTIRPERLKNFVDLDDVYALQIVSEYCSGNKSSYYSYELNLVMEDGTRMNVVDHGDTERLRDDAQRLAELLDRPLWDAGR